MSLTSIDRKLAELKAAMAAAAARDDFEEAARLRDEIARLTGHHGRGGGEVPDLVHKPPPGAMGLGTHLPINQPPRGWRPPKRPDPMTRGGGGRKRGR